MVIYHIKNYLRSFSKKNKIASALYSSANRLKVRFLAKISDESFAKLKYKENTGRILNLTNPETFNEKLWWLKLNNRNPLLTVCSDKVEVREYVKECGLEHILIPLIGVYEDANDIEFDKLPDEAFIKTNHGSGTNRLYKKNQYFDKNKFINDFNSSLKENYYLQSREWNYKNIKPRIIVEEVLRDEENVSLIDYRFFCFDGKVKLVFVDIETAADDGTHNPFAKRNIYDADFNLMDIKVKRENFPKSLIRIPENFKIMKEYAEKLAEPFPFCRVDLYNIKGQIYFGEITFYPGGGTQIVEPEKWEMKLGSCIDLNSNKIIYK